MGFEKWEGVHDSPDQKKRLASAKSSACTPIAVSPDTFSGTFSGSHGVYNTTLDTCTCVDFMRRKLPCKHIYRLAIELREIEEEANTDAKKIKHPVPAGLSLKEAVAVLEAAGDKAQVVLHDVLYLMFYKNKCDVVGVRVGEGLDSVINAGVLEICDNLPALLCAYRRNEIRDALIGAGVSGLNKNMKLDDLIIWTCENVPNASSIFSDAVAVRISDNFLKVSRKIYTYLNRRNEIENYYDEELVSHEIPKGSQIIANVMIDGSTSLSLEFPDDEITALLDQYGVNRCRNWKL